MANHLTPTELAREAGLERKEVIAKCVELGVPIFQGRIDKTLFMANIGHVTQATQTSSVTGASLTRRWERHTPPRRRGGVCVKKSYANFA